MYYQTSIIFYFPKFIFSSNIKIVSNFKRSLKIINHFTRLKIITKDHNCKS